MALGSMFAIATLHPEVRLGASAFFRHDIRMYELLLPRCGEGISPRILFRAIAIQSHSLATDV